MLQSTCNEIRDPSSNTNSLKSQHRNENIHGNTTASVAIYSILDMNRSSKRAGHLQLLELEFGQLGGIPLALQSEAPRI